MRIIAFANKNSGPAFHRIIMPLMLMEDTDVYITNDLKVEDFDKGCDIFMYNRILPEHAQPQLAELKKRHGFKTVVDIDDYWELDPHHVLYQEYQDIGFAAQQLQHLCQADAIFTTHERLAEEIRNALAANLTLGIRTEYPHYHRPEVHVLPNAIPHQGQFDITTICHDLVRLFWQGSVTHRQDIELLQAPINALNKLSKKIKMIMAGYTEGEHEWFSMANTYTANLKHQYKLIPGANVAEYYRAYEHADICLVPLVNSPFNRMKSNLKILEAANLGLPVIASAAHPYLGMPVNYCRNSRDWVGHIKRLVQFPRQRREEGERLADHCQIHFNFLKINNERRQILEHVATKANA